MVLSGGDWGVYIRFLYQPQFGTAQIILTSTGGDGIAWGSQQISSLFELLSTTSLSRFFYLLFWLLSKNKFHVLLGWKRYITSSRKEWACVIPTKLLFWANCTNWPLAGLGYRKLFLSHPLLTGRDCRWKWRTGSGRWIMDLAMCQTHH